MNVIARLHRFIAWDFSAGPPSSVRVSFVIGLLPFAPAYFLEAPFGAGDMILFCVAAAASLAWFAFVAWRFARIIKAHSAKADRKYDRHDKFELPPEYSTSESATLARRRKKRKSLPIENSDNRNQ